MGRAHKSPATRGITRYYYFSHFSYSDTIPHSYTTWHNYTALPDHLRDPTVYSYEHFRSVWKRICSPDIRNVSASEVLRNRALQIDIYLLTYYTTPMHGVSWLLNTTSFVLYITSKAGNVLNKYRMSLWTLFTRYSYVSVRQWRREAGASRGTCPGSAPVDELIELTQILNNELQ